MTAAVVPPLPRWLSLPLRAVPPLAHAAGAAVLLNLVLPRLARDLDLDFLQGRVVRVRVQDAGIEWRLTCGRGGFAPVQETRPADVTFEGNAYEFLLLALRREDPDTLFFQRRLRVSGDTEVGLGLKNLLDAIDWQLPDQPLPLRRWAEQALDRYAACAARLVPKDPSAARAV